MSCSRAARSAVQRSPSLRQHRRAPQPQGPQPPWGKQAWGQHHSHVQWSSCRAANTCRLLCAGLTLSLCRQTTCMPGASWPSCARQRLPKPVAPHPQPAPQAPPSRPKSSPSSPPSGPAAQPRLQERPRPPARSCPARLQPPHQLQPSRPSGPGAPAQQSLQARLPLHLPSQPAGGRLPQRQSQPAASSRPAGAAALARRLSRLQRPPGAPPIRSC